MTAVINIAIDGPAGVGKSTTAKLAAKRLSYIYLDTGAMYRVVCFEMLRLGLTIESPELKNVVKNLSFSWDAMGRIVINGQTFGEELRSPEVNGLVSQVAALGFVREALVAQQQARAQKKGVVMDGRDIGTVVLPEAELKIFMTASIEARVERRLNESGHLKVTREEVAKNLEERDRIDSSRTHSPLVQAKDAILLDTSQMTLEEQVNKVLELAHQKIAYGDEYESNHR